ncbi:hypothetical protein GOV14_02525 [Candidatus Pacearchaeota archaeon]|nr:hypothetical protein [Candidatus Pacearchaeota archaeon]
MDIELQYSPIISNNGNLTVKDYDNYLTSQGSVLIAKALAVGPLETAMKDALEEQEIDVFEYDDLKVKGKFQTRDNASWEKVYNSVLKFLEIRADDARAYDMDGLKALEGLGYCISTTDLRDFINGEVKKATSHSEFFQLYWPRKKKDEEFPTTILLPNRDYGRITEENVRAVLTAKRFCKGLETNVIDAFKTANRVWHEHETGYNNTDKLPTDKGGIKRARKISNGRYAFVNLIRKETPKYHEALDFMLAEISDMENKVFIKGYKSRQECGDTFVNIKNLYEQLGTEKLKEKDLVDISGRYEIAP